MYNLLHGIVWRLFVLLGTKLFDYIVIYAPGENVDAVTFASTEKYADDVADMYDEGVFRK